MMCDYKFIFSELPFFFAFMFILSMLDVLMYFVMACNEEFMK